MDSHCHRHVEAGSSTPLRSHRTYATAKAHTQPLSPPDELIQSVYDKPVKYMRDTRKDSRQSTDPSNNSQHRSAGGQQFRVGNIGQNGALYLRPISRQPQPFPTPPMTPPPCEGRTILSDNQKPTKDNWGESFDYSSNQSPQIDQERSRTRVKKEASRLPADTTTSFLRTRTNTFSSIVSDRPLLEARGGAPPLVKRPKDLKPASADLLKVSIPHARLGRPYFSGNGSPTLHSSLHTGSSTSVNQRLSTGAAVDQNTQKTTNLEGIDHPADLSPGMRRGIDHGTHGKRETLRGHVQFSPITGKILGATPSGLVAQITSPSSLDYELLSDFFLTFRSYMKSSELVDYLTARLRWAFERNDDFGNVVSVRTFVALRHWILNYFVDDFACDYNIRKQFCELINQLCQDLRKNNEGGNFKVLSELKKCWMRTCALYWDIPYLSGEGMAENILPGGLLGSRDASVVDGSASQKQTRASALGRNLDASSFGRFDVTQYSQETRVVTPPPDESLVWTTNQAAAKHIAGVNADGASDESDESVDDSWCAVPRRRQRQRAKQRVRSPSLTKSLVSGNSRKFAHLDKPSLASFRDSKINVPTLNSSNIVTMGSTTLLFPGSLIRGIVVHPSSPYIQGTPTQPSLEPQIRYTQSIDTDLDTCIESSKMNSGNNTLVKGFFKPMRRVLSTRKNQVPGYYGDGRPRPRRPSSEISDYRHPLRPMAATSTFTSVEKPAATRSMLRIDLLAATISESFTAAVKEEQIALQSTQNINSKKSPNESGLNAITARVSTLDPLNSNPVMNEGEIIGITEAPGPPKLANLQSFDTSDHRFETSKDTISDNVHGANTAIAIELTESSHDPSPTVMSSPTLPFRTLSTSMAHTMPGELELSDGYSAFTQPGYETSYTHFPSLESELYDHDQTKFQHSITRHDTTDASLGAGTTLSDATVTSNDDPFSLEHLPTRQLRRQPGGDLRAVDHVHSLLGLGPTHSIGSGSEGSRPLSQYPVENPEVDVDSPRQSIQILPTPPLPPLGRNSFELEVAKLAQLPDDEYDDGGRESALRKLEGLGEVNHFENDDQNQMSILRLDDDEESFGAIHREEGILGNVFTEPSRTNTPVQRDPILTTPGVLYPDESPVRSTTDVLRQSVTTSEDSYSSTPLLERGLSQSVMKRKNSSSDWLAVSLPDASSQEDAQAGVSELGAQVSQTYDLASSPVAGNDKNKHRLLTESSFASDSHQSFLLDDNQSLRSQSTITRDEAPDEQTSSGSGMRSFYNDDADNVSNFRVSDILPHPLRHTKLPMKTHDLFPEDTVQIPGVIEPIRHIPLQDRVDLHAKAATATVDIPDADGTQDDTNPPPASTAHYPFILCYDALTLAQQFTLIERDALSEIDWRELIDLRWSQAPNDTRNWVDYLKKDNVKRPDDLPLRGGVDICIARFNVIVKWAISEIVLTEDVTERVACIVKYIQIAQYARRLRNWATMFQITMALVSADVSRLKLTWSAVPEQEKAVLKSIEALIMPTRNFSNLRAEMEAAANASINDADAAIGSTGGSIPFIGIYTHDLTYNAQKPAFIKSVKSPADDDDDGEEEEEEPLVNFERHCAAAAIVKNLLRTAEASARYCFEAKPEVLSFGLWMAALGDKEIERRSRGLESGG